MLYLDKNKYRCCFCKNILKITNADDLGCYIYTCKKCDVIIRSSFKENYIAHINNNIFNISYYSEEKVYGIFIGDFSFEGLTKEQFINKIKTCLIFQ